MAAFNSCYNTVSYACPCLLCGAITFTSRCRYVRGCFFACSQALCRQALRELVPARSRAELEAFLPAWAKAYARLVMDNDRCRPACNLPWFPMVVPHGRARLAAW